MAAVVFIPTNPGQVYSINTDAVYPYKPPTRHDQFGDGGNKSERRSKSKVFFSHSKFFHHFLISNQTKKQKPSANFAVSRTKLRTTFFSN